MSKFLEGFLFRPQGKPMVYPYTLSAKISHMPWKFIWNESIIFRYYCYGMIFVVTPLIYKINKKLTSPDNKKFWKEKRKHDAEHHRQHIEKLWEVRT